MASIRNLILTSAVALGGAGLSACGPRHELQKLPNGDGTFVLTVDYMTRPFGTHDVVVSLQEKQGLASEVAVFRNIQSFNAKWLGPEDIEICQQGTVQDYKKGVTINARNGPQSFHFHYVCPPTG